MAQDSVGEIRMGKMEGKAGAGDASPLSLQVANRSTFPSISS
jgi:hypothetical protein